MANAEIIRSTFISSGRLEGERLFCAFSRGWFYIHTHFESVTKFRDINKALNYFEQYAIEGGG